jgi:hypothetical protein
MLPTGTANVAQCIIAAVWTQQVVFAGKEVADGVSLGRSLVQMTVNSVWMLGKYQLTTGAAKP